MALTRILFGSDPKLQRMLQYWAATAALYAVCIVLILAQVASGITARGPGLALCAYGVAGATFFYALVRSSFRLGIQPGTLAVLQGVFGLTCAMAIYAISGPLRDISLAMPLVVIAFCTFSLRPRQTLLLAVFGDAGLGATMWWLHARDPQGYPAAEQALTFAYLSAALVAIALLTGEMSKLRAHLKRQKDDLQAALATIRTLATVDELTSLANRRHMNQVLADEERRQGPRGQSTCIALLDIDFFKAVNDRFGHAAGDCVLRSFALAARQELRASDVLARWGGEEFLLLLPDTGIEEARGVLQRMAARVGAMQVPGVRLERRISFSGGLAARQDGESFAETISRADRALYQSKAAGRDRVSAA